MSVGAEANGKLDALARNTAARSDANTVSGISTAGHTAAAAIFVDGAATAASAGGVALRCFGRAVAMPVGAALAGAYVSDKLHLDDKLLHLAEPLGARAMAKPGRKAAHIEHQIAHDNAFAGAITGLLVGAAIVGGAILVVGTGGLAAAPLLGAAVYFGAGLAGSAVGGAVAKSASLCGPISSGSPDVFFEHKKAARVTDTAACTRHDDSQIIEGSESVFINGLPMARIGHHLSCNAVIQEACETVLGDDTTRAYGTARSSLNIAQQLFLSALEVVGMRSAVREGGLLNDQLRRVAGEPVDMATGDYADRRVDLELPGLLPLRLERVYPGRMRVEGALGPRWICNWSQRLLIDADGGTALLEDADGQRLRFALGTGALIDSTHLKAPYYRLTGTRARLRLFDARVGRFAVFEPGGDGVALLAAFEDRHGNRIAFQRDAAGHLLGVRLADDTWLRAETTPEGWLAALWIEGEAAPLVRYAYEPNGCLAHVAGLFTGELRYTYTPQGWLSSWADTGPTRLAIEYDADGRVIATSTGDAMFDDRFGYAPAERRSWHTDATGATRQFWFDAQNLLTMEEDPLGHRTVQEWDALERLQRRIDPAGRATRFAYDQAGRRVEQTDWAGRTIHWRYDDWGALLAVERPGGTKQWTYDAHGDLVAWTGADGVAGEAAYDERGALVARTVAGLGTTRWERDAAGQPLARTDPAGRTERYGWDRFGRLLSATDAGGRTVLYWYDRDHDNPRGAVSRVLRPDGGETRFAYDREGMLALRERDDGQAMRFTHGAFDSLRQVTDPRGATTEYGYTPTGRLATITNANGRQWRFGYDAAGWLVSETDWAGRETRYQRDALGRALVKRQADGAEQRFAWDERDRIVSVTAGADRIAFAYDDADRLVAATTHGRVDGAEQVLSEVTLAYDEAGRLVREVQNGVACTYRYDAAGRCVGRASPTGETAQAFGVGGELSGYSSNGHRLRFDYDASGLETLRAADAPGERTAFQLRQRYDPSGRLSEQHAGSAPVFGAGPADADPVGFARRYEWDRAGRLAGTLDGAGTRTRYRYDARDQVVEVERPDARETYAYDALLNLTDGLGGAQQYWHDCVVAAGPNRFRYDARGRMVERVATVDGFRPRTWRYHWDGFDRLAELETPEGARWRYTYDAFGRRVRKERVDAGAHGRVDFVWQGRSLAEAWHRRDDGDPAASVERWHYAPGGVRALAKETLHASRAANDEGDSAWFPVVTDQLGTPTALFEADGTPVWAAERQLWGRVRAARDLVRARASHEDRGEAAAGITCALRFAGQWEDEESGLHYNLHRYYDPDTAQYLSPDPIGVDGGLRTHAYVHDPLAWMDAAGLAGCTTASAGDAITRGPNGELLSVKGTIKPSDIGTGTPTNASSRAWARSLGNATDDAGHSRGANLGGSGGKDYVWPQDPHYNRGQFRDFEGDIADHVQSTNQPVNFEQTYQYGNGGTRPTAVNYSVSDMAGNPIMSRVFPNP